MSYKIGFIGAGNMGGCLITAATQTTMSKDICVFDKDAEKANYYSENYDVVSASLDEVLEAQIIVMGVKPQVYQILIDSIKDKICNREDDFLVVSMAAGVSMDSICEMFGKRIPLIRIMPNMACDTNEGVMVYDSNELVSHTTESEFVKIFSNVGLLDKLDENLIDAACAVTGCGPAFVYMFIEAMADGVVACGLPREKAIAYSAQMMKGAAAKTLEGEHPEKLKDKVCSPGGSTIAGVISLENAGFRGAVNSAVTSAYQRNKDLGKKNID
ncbi:MAG: pyrroline-5-carboxylate reductase [Clostridia bacterium]|nr:pyrroline-5-carboxylate reductase [Clostridia bacterium]